MTHTSFYGIMNFNNRLRIIPRPMFTVPVQRLENLFDGGVL